MGSNTHSGVIGDGLLIAELSDVAVTGHFFVEPRVDF